MSSASPDTPVVKNESLGNNTGATTGPFEDSQNTSTDIDNFVDGNIDEKVSEDPESAEEGENSNSMFPENILPSPPEKAPSPDPDEVLRSSPGEISASSSPEGELPSTPEKIMPSPPAKPLSSPPEKTTTPPAPDETVSPPSDEMLSSPPGEILSTPPGDEALSPQHHLTSSSSGIQVVLQGVRVTSTDYFVLFTNPIQVYIKAIQ